MKKEIINDIIVKYYLEDGYVAVDRYSNNIYQHAIYLDLNEDFNKHYYVKRIEQR